MQKADTSSLEEGTATAVSLMSRSVWISTLIQTRSDGRLRVSVSTQATSTLLEAAL